MLRSARNFHDGKKWATSNTAPSRTLQSDAKGANLNEVVRRFNMTGQLPVPRAVPRYMDLVNQPDFRGAMQVIVEAREAFEALPALIRERFGSPAAYVDFCDNPENKEEMIKLGLAKPDPVPVPEKVQKVEVVNAGVDSKGGDKRDTRGSSSGF